MDPAPGVSCSLPSDGPLAGLARGLEGAFAPPAKAGARPRAESLPMSREASAHAILELEQSLQRETRPGASPPAAARKAIAPCSDWRRLPSAMAKIDGIAAPGKRVIVFLDYDGTLTPIVADPAAATLSDAMRAAVQALADRATVAVVSGRAREKLRDFVRLPELYYAGSHGFDIDGPGGLRHSVSTEVVPLLASARDRLKEALAAIPGASVEDNRFSVSVHWRNVEDKDRPQVEAAVDDVMTEAPFKKALKLGRGKCVYELRPDVKWDKGEAVLYLLELLRRRETDGDESDGASVETPADAPPPPPGAAAAEEWYAGVLPVYVGDDTTDEDAFKALRPLGAVAVLVEPSGPSASVRAAERPRATHATHTLRDTDEVREFVDALARA